MPTFARQNRFTLTIPSAEPAFRVLAFTGDEAISTPFSFTVELVCERAELNLETLLHQPAFLAFGGPGHGVHGQISSINLSSPGTRLP